MERIEIGKSKIKIFIMLLICAVMAYVSFCLFENAEHYTSYIFRNTIFIKISGLVGSVFCVLGFITLLVKSFEKKAGLVIDNCGITDYSNAISIGLIKWEDIQSIRNTNVMSTKFLIIDVKNQEYYLNKIENKFKLTLMKSNIKLYGTPITINSSTLNCSFNELEKILRTAFENWNEKQQL